MNSKKLLAIFFLMAIAMAFSQKSSSVHEQTSFVEDSPLDRTVPIPQNVLGLLSQREEVKENLQEVSEAERKDLAQFFSASQIHLGPADEIDLIVKGNEGMGGADGAWFWVVRSAYKNPVIVLWEAGNGLNVLTTRTNGYRDIWTGWNSPSEELTELYKFDGGSYKLAKKSRRERRG